MNIIYTLSVNDEDEASPFSKSEIADFLYDHLDQYGDSRSSILKAISYAYGEKAGQGGFVLIAHNEKEILGTVVINKTNMSGYIPENILVYIAVHKKTRGKGVGKELMQRTINATDGDIALHVEADNPARFLYKKVGFTNPYLEMRLKK